MESGHSRGYSDRMETLAGLIATYGLIIVAIGAVVEGETVVVVAGFLAHQGLMNPVAVAIAAFVGSWAGDQGFFMLGRRFSGSKFVREQVERPAFTRVIALIEQNPIRFILAFRFLYGLRTVSPIAVGISNVPALTYLLFNTIAAAGWAAIMTGIGYLLGRTFHVSLGELPKIEHKLIAAAIVAVAVFVVVQLIHRRFRRTT